MIYLHLLACFPTRCHGEKVKETFPAKKENCFLSSPTPNSFISFLSNQITLTKFSWQSFVKTMPTSNKNSLVDTSSKAVNDEDLGVVLPPSSSPSNNASNLHSVLSEELEQESDKHSDLDSKLFTASGDDDAHEMPVKKVSHAYDHMHYEHSSFFISLAHRLMAHTRALSLFFFSLSFLQIAEAHRGSSRGGQQLCYSWTTFHEWNNASWIQSSFWIPTTSFFLSPSCRSNLPWPESSNIG